MLTNTRHLPLYLAFLFSWGCGDKNKSDAVDCNAIANPTLNTNTVVTAGDTVRLQPVIHGTPKSYQWIGPNSYFTSQRNAAINNIQASGAGKYTLTVTYPGGCTKTLVSDDIIVGLPNINCSLPANSALVDSVAVNFTSVTTSSAATVFTITGSRAGHKIVLQFTGTPRPSEGYYNIQPQGGPSDEGNVRLRYESATGVYFAATGKVHLRVAGNKITATFCEVSATAAGEPEISISGTVTES